MICLKWLIALSFNYLTSAGSAMTVGFIDWVNAKVQ
jgi:hypothetical protein